ncbi:hypothetical protein [Actinoallomurus sp. NPDC050550]|uniref:hypothetical protein n=1 Tax=Actinoallomurus sp. NPDC050550 TaxID=3154937 RepID=UPI0033E4B1EE
MQFAFWSALFLWCGGLVVASVVDGSSRSRLTQFSVLVGVAVVHAVGAILLALAIGRYGNNGARTGALIFEGALIVIALLALGDGFLVPAPGQIAAGALALVWPAICFACLLSPAARIYSTGSAA